MTPDMKGLPIFDQAEAERQKEEGMAHAEEGAGDWIDHAQECLRLVATGTEYLTTDDVWAVLGTDTIDNPRAMGPVMKRGAKEGWIRSTERHIPSKRPKSHARPIRVWKSLIYGADQRRGATEVEYRCPSCGTRDSAPSGYWRNLPPCSGGCGAKMEVVA